jgi:cation:H+ antiporter
MVAGVVAIVWGSEHCAENLARASTRLGVSSFALALLLAGAEPEELATAVAATLRGAPAIAFGDVVGANVNGMAVTMCGLAVGVGGRCRSALGRSVHHCMGHERQNRRGHGREWQHR